MKSGQVVVGAASGPVLLTAARANEYASADTTS
jgi:hypothetical protein